MNMNPMQMIMQMMNGGGNPMQIMNMFAGNPAMQQAQKMIQGGGDPKQIIMNVAQQQGMNMQQLQQMAQQFGIKL